MSGWWLASYLVLWALVAGLTVIVLAFVRQLGVLYASLSRDGIMLSPHREGPPIGSTVGALLVKDARDGDKIEIPASSQPLTFLLFVSESCLMCRRAVRDTCEVLQGREDVVLVLISNSSDGTPDFLLEVRGTMRCVVDAQLAAIFGVESEPYGLLLSSTGLVLGHQGINHAGHVQQLLDRADDDQAKSPSSPLKGAASGSPGHS